MKPVEEQGYLIVATNTENTDYVDCGRVLAKTIKHWHPTARICLLTNEKLESDCLFDYVHEFPFPIDVANPYANDWQIGRAHV